MDGVNWYEYCYNNPTKYVDINGLWGGYRENHTTVTLNVAKNLGYPYQDAITIAIWNEWVDNPKSGICPVPGIGDPSWHFNINRSPKTDSRIIHANDCLKTAREYMEIGLRDMALVFIGMGLHAIQDISAHDVFDYRQSPNIHPSQYDNPDLDFNKKGIRQYSLIYGTGGYLQFQIGSTRISKCYSDTYKYLSNAWKILFPSRFVVNFQTDWL